MIGLHPVATFVNFDCKW